jgi:hypothetical protein
MYVALYSSNYHPAHAQHMHAYARALQACGLSVCLWAPSAYFDNHAALRGFARTDGDGSGRELGRELGPRSRPPRCDVVIVLNMGLGNLMRTPVWRMQGRRVLFCVHEPIRNMAEFDILGLSKRQLAKLWVQRALIGLQIRLSSALIAFSRKTAAELNAKPVSKNQAQKQVVLHPLLYVDQNAASDLQTPDPQNPEPQTHAPQTPNAIAYIGTIASDHAFAPFVAFVEHCLKTGLFPEHRFVIATKSAFDPNHFAALGAQAARRVTVQSGRLLSEDAINGFYASAAVIWCAYYRSNQSGVLPKAYMFGVPVLSGPQQRDDHVQPGVLGAEIASYAVQDIAQAVQSILADHPQLSNACRRYYLATFDYKSNLPVVKKMVFAHD